jgi:hypothetical protein
VTSLGWGGSGNEMCVIKALEVKRNLTANVQGILNEFLEVDTWVDSALPPTGVSQCRRCQGTEGACLPCIDGSEFLAPAHRSGFRKSELLYLGINSSLLLVWAIKTG